MRAWEAEHPRIRLQRAIPGESRVERSFREWIESPDGKRVEAEVAGRAFALLHRGRSRYGIAALIEAIRYDFAIRLEGADGFRINNSHRSLLARRVMERHPALEGFFETRGLHGRA